MLIRHGAILAAAFSCLATQAIAQQQPNRFDVTHCYAGTTSAFAQGQAYNIFSLDIRGTLHAAQQGAPLDHHVVRCFATGGTVGSSPTRVSGFCEVSSSPEDRILLQWAVEAGRGSASFLAGIGRYKGISGQFSFQPIGGPFPAPEPGVLRGCSQWIGEYRLP